MCAASSTKLLHLFLNSKQKTKLKTANRGGTLFTTICPGVSLSVGGGGGEGGSLSGRGLCHGGRF